MTLQPAIVFVEHLFRKVNIILMLDDGERIYENVKYFGCRRNKSGFNMTVIDNQKRRLSMDSEQVVFRNTSLTEYYPPSKSMKMQIGDCLLRFSQQ